MAESLNIVMTESKQQRYQSLLPQLEALISSETDLIANLANISAALKQAMGFFWVGFYIAREPDMLVLGPFQGPIACTRIPKGKGVCGTVFADGTPLIVPDVDQFPGHIACSSDSKSEIVLPALNQQGQVALILDIDSDQLDDFDQVDLEYLSQLMKLIEKQL